MRGLHFGSPPSSANGPRTGFVLLESSGLPIARVRVGGIIRLIGGTCYETFRPPCSFALGIGFDLWG
jgi:hypothetical protein